MANDETTIYLIERLEDADEAHEWDNCPQYQWWDGGWWNSRGAASHWATARGAEHEIKRLLKYRPGTRCRVATFTATAFGPVRGN